MTIHVDVITPEKLAISDDVDFIAAPAADGEIGILEQHTPLLTRLGVGELRLKKGNETRHFAIAGGFLEVSAGSRVAVFAETAEMADEIDLERARLAADRAKTTLATARDLTGAELANVEMALARASVRLKIGDIKRRHSPHS